MANNVGDPFDPHGHYVNMNTVEFEREVIERLAPLYGFDKDNLWGIVTFSGTDGNNHGIIFRRKISRKENGHEACCVCLRFGALLIKKACGLAEFGACIDSFRRSRENDS